MFARPIRFDLLLTCALATLTCCEVRGQIPAEDDYVPGSSAIFTMSINPPFGTGTPVTMQLLGSDFYITRLAELGVGMGGFNDRIPTEIKDLTLEGNSPVFGDIRVRIGDENNNSLSPVQEGPTDGFIRFVISPGTMGDKTDFASGTSFFNVRFEVDVIQAGMTLYNRASDPHELQIGPIFTLPPIGSDHIPSGVPPFVILYRRMGLTNDYDVDPPVGIAFGSHLLLPFDPTFIPEPSSLALLGFGCVGLAGRRRRRA